ncbi:caspase family protein [Streptomyces chilikensis]|uniref:caspase family protein n=1 Tax=Streptomyces chilikensis TaxID=1194079 RepID=UPI000AE5C1AB|nr:caspase family protein [Streptomyces chilikensis]
MRESRHALIIANDHYDDEGLKKLKAPAQDAEALAGVLEDPQIGDFDVEVVRNAQADVMRRRIQHFFSDRRRDDTLVLHFSCHGLKSESGELYFAARDSEMRMLDATAIPSQFVRTCMSRTRAGRTVLLLDCCYGGAFSRGASVRAAGDVNVLESFRTDKAPGGRGWAVITAADSMEYAFEGPELAEKSSPRPSVFTHAVVEGLRTGEADRDEDGEIRLNELYDYIYERVQDENPNQTPKRTVEMQGDPWLAHSRRGRIKIAAVPSPPFLQSAITSENVVTRLGAVTELDRRLRDDDLPVAEGARQALEEITRNDLGHIADQAHAALQVIHLQPSPASLDFGKVRQGSTPAEKSVMLGGPPLARHCVAQSTQRWLRVEPLPNGFNVAVEADTPGHLTGDIELKGVADESVVHVEVTVEPQVATAPDAPVPAPQEPEDRPKEAVVVHPPASEDQPETLTRETRVTSEPPVSESWPAAEPLEPQPVAEHAEEPRSATERREATSPQQPPAKSVRAVVTAATGLALAAISALYLILAVVGAIKAAEEQQPNVDDIGDRLSSHGVSTSLTVCLVTAVIALLLRVLARHDLSAHPRLYPRQATNAVKSLASSAKVLAVPVLVLAILMAIAYPVISNYL